MPKMLIVYYSWSNGNTERIAKELQSATGADIARIETVEPYTGSHQQVVDQGLRETEAGYMPPIRPLEKDPADYDVIAIGTPTWWYTMAPAVKTFLSEVYSVTQEFDRMGCRLDGPIIEHKNGGDIISDGIAFGAIQVPSAGKPIIMLADRQTTGGYTKIANVISADFRILAQLKAGDKIRFEKISIAAAEEALIAQRAALRTFKWAFHI